MVFTTLFLFLLVYGGFKLFSPVKSEEVAEVEAEVIEDIVDYDAFISGEPDVTYTVQDGDVLSDVFKGYEIPYTEVLALDGASEDVFPFRNVQVGKDVHFYLYELGSDLRLKEVLYQPDSTRYIRAEQTSGGWIVTEEKIPYVFQESLATGSIESSLYLSGLEQGVDEKVILEFADVFAWDVDFALETRSGDTYKMIFEEKYLNGVLITTGRILAGEYINAGTSFRAFYFVDPNGTGAYYNEEGAAVQKAFLKAPVNFRYVSSGFSNARFHPIIGRSIPHNGIDYAAATGTPIISIGTGVVTKAGWGGAYGNEVRIRHNDRYTSQYAHMSAFGKGIKPGTRVSQGQVIGFVGSTGYSTGPHLHFGMIERGGFINPKNVDAPEGEPISDEYKEEFNQLVQQRLSELESL